MEYPRCPVCHAVVDRLISTFNGSGERAVIAKLQARHGTWRPEDGLCSRCFFLNEYETVAEHFEDAGRGSLFRLRLSNEFALLPTPLRMDADPRFTGKGVTIAFIDAGFYPHRDLLRPTKRISAIVDLSDERKPATYFKTPHAESWHGTMTSVTAAGSGHISGGLYKGIASEAEVVLIKVMDTRTKRITTSSIERGLRWTIDNSKRYRIRIISISVGGDSPEVASPQAVHDLVEEAVGEGIVVIAAGGNSPDQPLVPPASAPSAITVGGLDDRNQLREELRALYHSSFGTTSGGVHKPEIVAPAMWIAGPILPKTEQYRESQALFRILQASARTITAVVKKYAQDLPTPPVTEDYRSWARILVREREYVHPSFKNMDGTSLAAPIVSSIVAQMFQANPGLSPNRIREILLATAVPLSNTPDERQGYGMPTARAAVQRALDDIRSPASPGVLAAEDLQHMAEVTFCLHHHSARSVAVAGDFNNWDVSRTLLYERSPGEWICSLQLPARGTYAYKFIVNGSEWIADPINNRHQPDGYGGMNSLLSTMTDYR